MRAAFVWASSVDDVIEALGGAVARGEGAATAAKRRGRGGEGRRRRRRRGGEEARRR